MPCSNGGAVDVALTQVDAADLGPLEIGAGDGEHRVAVVDADRTLDALVGEQLQHAPRAGAEVEHRPVGTLVGDIEDRRLDDRIGGVQRAFLVPVVGDAGEVLLGGGGPAAADDLEPVEVDRR